MLKTFISPVAAHSMRALNSALSHYAASVKTMGSELNRAQTGQISQYTHNTAHSSLLFYLPNCKQL